MDKNFEAFLLCGSPHHTMVPTLLTVTTSSGKRERFEKNVNSVFLDRKGNEEFLFLFNIPVSIFKMKFHNRNCANNSTQWKTDKLPAFLTNNHPFLFSYECLNTNPSFPANRAQNWISKYLDLLPNCTTSLLHSLSSQCNKSAPLFLHHLLPSVHLLSQPPCDSSNFLLCA